MIAREAPRQDLTGLLGEAFGFSSFRPFQEDVCRAVTQGQDCLLVMPTGAGKSLCYQLPGIARGGTTLVVSPLIALMEDQVTKLLRQGFQAARIHSGRNRADSRQACIDYLAGKLDFLFIAPERLGVPGFPEMLARRKPALVAIDEAHCISCWGHDFRPDYRMLGERLPLLRPAPIVALTATATPIVQDDIVEQLGLSQAKRFIHGFRRTNIALEIVELTPSLREEACAKILKDDANRPAILYAPTRKQAEELAAELGKTFSCAAYHAGLSASLRDSIQTSFLGGTLDVIVATTAFGMGVDKADVRTVIHLALPGSVEGYYQELGRAGRDGQPARAILLYSWVDRRTHEFFHERDYPAASVLQQLHRVLTEDPQPKEGVRKRARLKADEFDKVLEKLWVHGAAGVDADDNVWLQDAGDDWVDEYEAQRRHKEAELQMMSRFAEANGCRMLHLVKHFGDQDDVGTACGVCDVCAPDACVARKHRAPNDEEQRMLAAVLTAVKRNDGAATGRLYRDHFEGAGLDRKSFEHLLGGLVRAGLVQLETDRFTKDGRSIDFLRACLTKQGRADASMGDVLLVEESPKSKKKAKGKKGRGERPALDDATLDDASPVVVEALKAWRREEARARGIPAFRILTDKSLFTIAAVRPRDRDALLTVRGVGGKVVEKYGDEILKLVSAG